MSRRVGIQGGCMCGAVRYECAGEPLYTGYCHCRSCRHHSGAAVAGMLVFNPENVQIEAEDLQRIAFNRTHFVGRIKRVSPLYSVENRADSDAKPGSRSDSDFVSSALGIYVSSPGIERGFCRQCGTSLTWKGRGLMSIHIGTLDDPTGHAPTLHWRDEERLPWCDAGRDLPRVKMAFPDSAEATD